MKTLYTAKTDGFICYFYLCFAGGISGLLLGITATLAKATTYDGGLNKFLKNTVQDHAILAGTCTSFGASLLGCIIVSLFTHDIESKQDADTEWQKIYDIDNPLNPWELYYKEELKGLHYDRKPTFEQMSATFRKAKITAYIGGACSIVLMALIIPGIMASFSVLDGTQFSVWVGFTQAWAVIMAIVVIVAPPAEEITRIVKQYRKNKAQHSESNGRPEDLLMNEINLNDKHYDPKQPIAKI